MTIASETVQVRRAAAADGAAVSEILAEAFFDDPVISWAFPDDDRRRELLPDVFSLFVDGSLPAGEVRVTEDTTGAALWMRPASQGKGVGSALMQPVLEQCDRHGVAAHLEVPVAVRGPAGRAAGSETRCSRPTGEGPARRRGGCRGRCDSGASSDHSGPAGPTRRAARFRDGPPARTAPPPAPAAGGCLALGPHEAKVLNPHAPLVAWARPDSPVGGDGAVAELPRRPLDRSQRAVDAHKSRAGRVHGARPHLVFALPLQLRPEAFLGRSVLRRSLSRVYRPVHHRVYRACIRARSVTQP
jgi:GNAT superfamily N-acetyltransferase